MADPRTVLEEISVGGHGVAFGDDPDFNEIMKSHKQDQDDKRCLRGKYAPKTGTCRVCQGKVVAEIAFHNDGRIGGPAQPGYVSGWHCEGCFAVYWRCPP